MKLKELATIKRGIKLDAKYLQKIPMLAGTYISYYTLESFLSNNIASNVATKDLRKLEISKDRLLSYGDYLLFKTGEKWTFHRYDSISGQTLVNEDFFVIRSDFGIVNDFFSYLNNREYFYSQLNNYTEITELSIGEINIFTDDIEELQRPNESEILGLRNPLQEDEVSRIRMTQKVITLDKLLKRVKYKEIILDTDFQRRPGLWDYGRKSRLIESIILGLSIPAFYFDATNNEGNKDDWQVIDGLQRISAVKEFIVEEKFTLTELDYLPHLEGTKFSDLERIHQRKIEEFEIIAYILDRGTPKSIVYKMFKSINTSALRLESQEIRHAINPGKPAEWLKKVGDSEWFKKVGHSPRQHERMENREAVLRFMAFRQRKYQAYTPDMQNFLDKAMTDIYRIPQQDLDLYEQELKIVVELLIAILGEFAFSRKMFDTNRAFRVNNIIFELLTFGFSGLTKEKANQFKNKKNNISERIKSYFKGKPASFWESDYAYSKSGISERFEGMEKLMKTLTT